MPQRTLPFVRTRVNSDRLLGSDSRRSGDPLVHLFKHPSTSSGVAFEYSRSFGDLALVGWAYAIVATFVLLKIVDARFGLRVDEKVEIAGLDASQPGELAYQQARLTWMDELSPYLEHVPGGATFRPASLEPRSPSLELNG